jgi:TonB-linked SusC/RagA family outer membrane protein
LLTLDQAFPQQGKTIRSTVTATAEHLFEGYDVKFAVYDRQIILANKQESGLIDELQQQRVTGKVTDATTGEPLPGVNIVVVGANIGAISDAAGNYSIDLTNPNATLEFTFIGYLKLSVPVERRRVIDVQLAQEVKQLDEIVVVGYGTQKRVTMTGSVVTIDNKAFLDRSPVQNPLAAMQGQVPGMLVTRTSAMPGRENWNFQIRGASSINGSDPLIIVDGQPYVDNTILNSINPSDIENISILKDAAATAIYGARAAGGVVLITTKRATGKPVIEYNASISVKKLGLMPTLMNLKQYVETGLEVYANDLHPSDPVAILCELIRDNPVGSYWDCLLKGNPIGDFDDVLDYTFFDNTWPKILWDDALSTEHQVSISSKGETMGYRLSFGYMKDNSLLQWGRNSNSRYNIRLAHDYSFSKKLKLETNISLERNVIIQPTRMSDVLGNYQQPGFPVTAINGKPYAWGSQYSPNMLAEYGGDTRENNTRLNTNIKLTYNILEDLHFIGSAGYSYGPSTTSIQENTIKWYNYAETVQTLTYPTRSSYQQISNIYSYYNLNGYLEYNKTFANAHNVSMMFGSQIERDEISSFNAKTLDIISPDVPSLSLGYGDASTKSIGESKSHWALAGYFSRIRYSYMDKYLFEANARYDGTSRFTPENRWKLFYGFSGGWRVTQEGFMQNQKIVNNMKLRASWGSVGNQAGINLYDYIQLLNLSYSLGPTSSGFPIIGTAPVVRIAPSSTLVSLDRTWERIQNINIGLDLGFLKDRLTGSFDYYIKNNNNMLLSVTYPATLGASSPKTNSGKLRSWGWEAILGWRDKVGNITYYINANISNNQNKLVDFGGLSIKSSGYNTSVEGYPIGSYFGLQYAGRIQTQEQLDAYKALKGIIPLGATPSSGVQIGDNMFKDVDGDGKLTTPNDLIFLGTDVPLYSFAINMGLQWKGFDFSPVFQGVGKRIIIRSNNWRMPWATSYQAQNAAFYRETWSADRTDARLPRLSGTGAINNYNYQASDFIAEKGN